MITGSEKEYRHRDEKIGLLAIQDFVGEVNEYLQIEEIRIAKSHGKWFISNLWKAGNMIGI